ncbi:MAG: shikimate dehydrogenase [Gammaproteobacteria bacterium]|nr:shikimate dehydrogenase [Gammaproteobacteria bacterium]
MSEPDKYAVIGHPINHSKSPVIHKLFGEQTGENISYEAIDLPTEELHAGITRFIALGGRGLNVTVPHKQDVIELMDSMTLRAEVAGAVNTITKLEDGSLQGDNTDGIGLVTDLTANLGLDIENMRILVLGAGGAARGILASLAEIRPDELMCANRRLERALEIRDELADIGRISARSFEELTDEEAEVGVFDLVINATSAGLEGNVAPFPENIVTAETLCYDLSYSMRETPFVTWAKEHGCKQAVQGWGMLVEQAAESFYIWRDIRPDTTDVRAKLPT